jgi:hypothetical protein
MLRIGLCTHLRSLELGRTQLITPLGWTAVCRASGSLHSLTLENLGFFDDERVWEMLSVTKQLRRLKLLSLTMCKGESLVSFFSCAMRACDAANGSPFWLSRPELHEKATLSTSLF